MRTTAVDDDDNVLSSRPMKPAILIGVLALPVLFVACKSTPQNTPASESAPPAKRAALPIGSGFDYYLLNLSWSPEFCYSHPDAAECGSHFTFVLHGLWPQNKDGTYPENCSNAPGPTDPSAFKDIYPDPGLLEHEWRAHGTCSGLDAGAFFTTARTAVHSIAIPSELTSLTAQTSMPPAEIVSLFTRSNPTIPGDSFAISCGHNFLTAVQICLDKTLHPIACGPIRFCRANAVRIPPPR
jgi:ribonuclease T2